MTRWLFSLQFRLILGFAVVLMLALAAVGIYSNLAAQREVRELRTAADEALIARVQEAFTEFYVETGSWNGIASTVERVSYLTGREIAILDREGKVLVATRWRSGSERPPHDQDYTSSRIFVGGDHVGSVLIGPVASRRTFRPYRGGDRSPPGPPEALREIQEPSLRRFTDTTFQSLLLSGLGAGVGGILLVSLLSRRLLTSVRRLTAAAQKLGQGDLSQRVTVSGRDEIGELTSTFNAMAEGLENAERQRRNIWLRTLPTNCGLLCPTYAATLRRSVTVCWKPMRRQSRAFIDRRCISLKLVEDLRLLAETEAADFQLDLEPGLLEEVVSRSVEAFRPQAQSKAIELAFNSGTDRAELSGRLVSIDRTRIEQVMNNLLQNAVEHTTEGGRIDVSVAESDETVSVTVADTGEGIPSEDLPHVFDRLYRADPSRTRSTGGAGLGLTIAKQLIEAHGGTIRVESTEGEGSRFTLALPAA